MDAVLIATIGGTLSLLFWGIGDYVAGKSGQHTDAALTVSIIQFVNVLLLFPVVAWYGIPFNLTVPILIVAISAAASTIAYISFVKSLTIGPLGVAAPIGNAYPFITLIIGILLLGFDLSLLRLMALITIIIGVIMLATNRTTFHFKKLPSPTVFFALLAMIFWGIGFALFEPVIEHFAWHQLLFINAVFMTLFAFLYHVFKRRALPSLESIGYRNNRFAWQTGVWITLGAVTFFAATEHIGSVAIPAVLASASPLATSFLAYYRDGEKLTLLKRVGAVVVVLGIMLLNI